MRPLAMAFLLAVLSALPCRADVPPKNMTLIECGLDLTGIDVGGQVRHPDRLSWVRGLTVAAAIQQTGGLTREAGSRVWVTRAGRTFQLDLRRPQDKARLLPEGDTVEIMKVGFFGE